MYLTERQSRVVVEFVPPGAGSAHRARSRSSESTGWRVERGLSREAGDGMISVDDSWATARRARSRVPAARAQGRAHMLGPVQGAAVAEATRN